MSINLSIFSEEELQFIFYVLNEVVPCGIKIDDNTIKAYRLEAFIKHIINSKSKINKKPESAKLYNNIIKKIKNEYKI